MFAIAYILFKIDFYWKPGCNLLSDILRINCCGTCFVPDNWSDTRHNGINRLYYIHKGIGGYIMNGVSHSFTPGMLYFFPYTTRYTLFSDAGDKIYHTYADFELVPPVISRKVISYDVTQSEMAMRALDVFVEGGRLCSEGKLLIKTGSSDLHKLCFSAITYLTSVAVASSSDAKTADDPVVISALEIMLENMDKQITVNDIASGLYLSPDSFIRRFRRCIGVTPYAYLRELRLRSAQYMLSEGRSLAQTAAAVGYSDASALIHALKKISAI